MLVIWLIKVVGYGWLLVIVDRIHSLARVAQVNIWAVVRYYYGLMSMTLGTLISYEKQDSISETVQSWHAR